MQAWLERHFVPYIPCIPLVWVCIAKVVHLEMALSDQNPDILSLYIIPRRDLIQLININTRTYSLTRSYMYVPDIHNGISTRFPPCYCTVCMCAYENGIDTVGLLCHIYMYI